MNRSLLFALGPALAGLALVLAHCAGRSPSTAQTPRQTATHVPPVPHASGPSSSGVTLTVRCQQPTHPISPLIYGIGVQPNHNEPHQWKLGATARRWGGNHTSRYNWELGNAWNTGKDWFFRNVDYDAGAQGPAHARFIEADLSHEAATALTLPMIGWVARDTTSYSFPVSVHGPQDATAPENPDMGNGLHGKRELPPGPPDRTSVAMTPESVGRWVRSLRERDGKRGKRGVQMYILDNEPTLWSETHRDVHPKPVSYDELLERTVAYATEVRRADPEALIAGPALWGWSAYFGSGVDHAAQPAHPDRDAHGGVPMLPWWLRQVAAHEKRTGTRLIDVVDVHFYPQGEGLGIGTSGDTSPEASARRIRSTRALWDPSYKDESWINDTVRLIPRLKAWIDQERPGSGISIGEYNFGAEQHMSGGLAVAEALGRFGQQGITSAFYWDYPAANSPAFWAFRAYRDFDGEGGRFQDLSVEASSSDPRVSLFASRDPDGQRLVLVLLALDPTAPLRASLDASSCGSITAQRRFTYTGGPAGFARAPDQAPADAPLPLPPYSISVLDLHINPHP